MLLLRNTQKNDYKYRTIAISTDKTEGSNGDKTVSNETIHLSLKRNNNKN